MEPWAVDSWQALPIKQQPVYPDKGKLEEVLRKVASLPELLPVEEVDQLRQELAAVSRGEKFFLQGGDCAERFLDCTREHVKSLVSVLLDMGEALEAAAGVPAVCIGRLAGQYSKPRSNDMETVTVAGHAGEAASPSASSVDENSNSNSPAAPPQQLLTVPVFRGDNINSINPLQRQPDPLRLLQGYSHSAQTLQLLQQVLLSQQGGREEKKGSSAAPAAAGAGAGVASEQHQHQQHLHETLRTSYIAGPSADPASGVESTAAGAGPALVASKRVYVSHEGLLLPYEAAMTRSCCKRKGTAAKDGETSTSTAIPAGLCSCSLLDSALQRSRAAATSTAEAAGPPSHLLAVRAAAAEEEEEEEEEEEDEDEGGCADCDQAAGFVSPQLLQQPGGTSTASLAEEGGLQASLPSDSAREVTLVPSISVPSSRSDSRAGSPTDGITTQTASTSHSVRSSEEELETEALAAAVGAAPAGKKSETTAESSSSSSSSSSSVSHVKAASRKEERKQRQCKVHPRLHPPPLATPRASASSSSTNLSALGGAEAAAAAVDGATVPFASASAAFSATVTAAPAPVDSPSTASSHCSSCESCFYNSSAHFLWIGDRTRQVDHAHVEYFRGIANPIGVKIGPATQPAELQALLQKLWPEPSKCPGRITLILRLGKAAVEEKLPGLVAAVQQLKLPVPPVWVCDPMHGNTRLLPLCGLKTRHYQDILSEITACFRLLREAGSFLGGIHLELTGSSHVTECLGGPQQLQEEDVPRCYTTYCDPRLNRQQSLQLAAEVGRLLQEDRLLRAVAGGKVKHVGGSVTVASEGVVVEGGAAGSGV